MPHQWSRRRVLAAGAAMASGPALGGMWPRVCSAGAAAEPADLCAVAGADPYLATLKAIEQLGGMGRLVPKGATVGLLINHQFRNPGAHVHPDVAAAVAALCWEAGAKSVLSLKDERFAYWPRQGRAADAARRLTACSGQYVTVELPRGQALRKAEVIKEFFSADVLINVSVAKDHEGTRYACVLKNAMGALTYTTCQFFHFGHGKGGWYGDVEFLSQCVADLNLLRKPDLAVADATTVLTSNGPFGPGKLAKPQTVVAGVSAVSVDAYCTRFLGVDASRVGMIARSAALGLGETDLSKVKLREFSI
jgi:uncharacterized protein (DUF362 family)